MQGSYRIEIHVFLSLQTVLTLLYGLVQFPVSADLKSHLLSVWSIARFTSTALSLNIGALADLFIALRHINSLE